MMDPEMIRLAQEQMSRIPPGEFMRMQQQMMSNPELIRLATENMKNMRPDDFRLAAEQMKNIKPEEMAEMSSRIANVSPQDIAAMKVQADAQATYQIQGAMNLKNQGNHLHGIGKYADAIEKYYRAKQNLSSILKPEAATLRLTCSLNLMSCYLKTGEFGKVVEEGTEVLGSDSNNRKALYRRGQAYKELGKLKLAYTDLKKAAEIAMDDQVVQDAFRQIEDQLKTEGESLEENIQPPRRDGPLIEEITEVEAERLSRASTVTRAQEEVKNSARVSGVEGKKEVSMDTSGLTQTIDNLKQNPEMMRSMFSMMDNLSPEHIAAVSGGQMTPEMAKMASNMVKQMSPEDMQRMFDMMSSLNKPAVADVPGTSVSSSTQDPLPSRGMSGLSENVRPDFAQGPPKISSELQEQMRQQLKDPAMKQMMASMLQNMTPESMVSMSEQMGFKISREDAEKTHSMISKMGPDSIEQMMKWVDRAQRAVDVARKGKDYILGRKGLVLAIVMLVIAVILHWLGVIGG